MIGNGRISETGDAVKPDCPCRSMTVGKGFDTDTAGAYDAFR